MIAHFALMGDLYQYDPYDTEASLWNSYPWQIGADNSLDFKGSVPAFTMSKTIWDIDDSDSSAGASNAVLGSFSMFATLILMDNLGNFGDGIGSEPENFVLDSIYTTSGTVISVQSRSKIVIQSANSERLDEPVKLLSTLSGGVLSVSSALIIVYGNTNSERADEPVKLISTLSGTVVSITSETT